MVQALLTLMLLFPLYVFAQTRIIQGEILDKQSDEPIPFVSVRFAVQGGYYFEPLTLLRRDLNGNMAHMFTPL